VMLRCKSYLYSIQCYSHSVVTVYATCTAISHAQCSVLYTSTSRSKCAVPVWLFAVVT
jgi:hypothetical protein